LTKPKKKGEEKGGEEKERNAGRRKEWFTAQLCPPPTIRDHCRGGPPLSDSVGGKKKVEGRKKKREK